MLPVLLGAMLQGCSGSDGTSAPPDGVTATSDTGASTPSTPSTPWSWPSAALVLPEVTVVDASGARGPVTIVVSEGRIAGVLEEPGPIPDDAEVLDTAGAWVVPGLIDPHVHLFLSGSPWWVGDTLASNLSATVAAGVTTVVDAGGPLAGVALRDRIRAGDILGPDVLVLGPMVTAPGSHPCEVTWDESFCSFVTDEAQGAEAGADRVAAGTDGIKVALADADFTPWPTPRLDVAAMAAAVGATPGLTYAHVDQEEDALAALDAGVAHLAHPVFGGPPGAGAVARIASDASATHTTLGAFSGTLELLDGTLPIDDDTVDPRVADAWAWVRSHPAQVDPDWILGSQAWSAEASATLGLLQDAGAVLLPASDAGYLYVPHGLGLHLELDRLIAEGWDAEALLGASTAGAADALGLWDRGRVEEGLRADLLVVPSDPRADLGVLRRPSQVLLEGQVWRDAELVAADPLLAPAMTGTGGWCLDDRDCDSSRCDLVDHVCAEACDVVGQLDDPCGSGAWCAAAEGDQGDPVCHQVRTCDLYDTTSCAPAPYSERCVPLDFDTAGCFPAGPRVAGQSCDPVDTAQACEPGLFCSWFDHRCWILCNPDDGSACPVGSTCVDQRLGPQDWFGLCE